MSLRHSLVALILIGTALMLTACQNQFVYYPEKGSRKELESLARNAGIVPWEDAEGRYLGWKTEHPEPPPNRIVFFHGNAGHALHRTYFADGFRALDKGSLWEVHLFEYPGYGAREGKPGERSFQEASVAAFRELKADDDRPVFLAGESIGSGPATHVAGCFPGEVAGIFLITPFTNLADVGRHHIGRALVALFLRDRYDNEAALQDYSGPVAFLLAGRDEVVPPLLGEKLYEGYPGPKKLWIQKQAGHNTLDYDPRAEWWREVSDFLLEGG